MSLNYHPICSIHPALFAISPTQLHQNFYLEYDINVKVFTSLPGYADSEVTFTASIPMRDSEPRRLPSTNLTSIVLPELSCVTELEFFTLGSLNPTSRSFFGCFTSVKTLQAGKKTLRNLMQLQYDINATDNEFIIFPLLETLSLDDSWLGSHNSTINDETIEFIVWRIKAGHPITTLGFINQVSLIVAQDLEALSKSEGFVEGYRYVQHRSFQRIGRHV